MVVFFLCLAWEISSEVVANKCIKSVGGKHNADMQAHYLVTMLLPNAHEAAEHVVSHLLAALSTTFHPVAATTLVL